MVSFLRMWVAVIVASALSGCATTFDYYAEFSISGRVQDKSSNIDVSNASIQVIDFGLDYARGKSKEYLIASGTTDSAGTIDLPFHYFWGSVGLRPKYGSLGIRLKAEGYQEEVITLTLSEDAFTGGKYRFCLGNVFLDSGLTMPEER